MMAPAVLTTEMIDAIVDSLPTLADGLRAHPGMVSWVEARRLNQEGP